MKKSDAFFPASAATLLGWMLDDLSRGEIFGIARSLFFTPSSADPFRTSRFGRLLETPLGVAAGPHSQMAQNIVAAWLCGARFIELKTVQVLDELSVTKPCIEARDEGYNCEWSQELKLEESFGQYLAAMVLLCVLRDALGHAVNDAASGPGFILNMSAGYNLEGLKSPAMRRFLDRMASCPEEVETLRQSLMPLYPRLETLTLPDFVSDNLTLSTMHGCPPDEIERIARHFLEERRMHTCVKLNPTLLGSDAVRALVHSRLGYPVTIPDEAFGHDLKFAEAVELVSSLQEAAKKSGAHFGVKLTNTLEVVNAGNLPAGEKMLYLSGRALHPVSIALAAKLREQFGGGLDISFCAGVDAFNAGAVLGAGLSPVTVCTDLLKPGGYGRLRQCVEAMRSAPKLDVSEYALQAADDPRYRKDAHPYPSIKGARDLTSFDCAAAPCMEACGAGQDIPGYLRMAAQGRFEDSLAVILATNPFPNLLGAFCDRLCQPRCNRIHLDRPVRIREVKRVAAQAGVPPAPNASDPGLATAQALSEERAVAAARQAGEIEHGFGRVTVRGSGLAGLACAYFLARSGTGVDVYGPCPKSQAKLLDSPAGKRDVAAILASGVRQLEGNAPGDIPGDALDCTGGTDTGPGVLAAAVGRGRAVALAYLKAHKPVMSQMGQMSQTGQAALVTGSIPSVDVFQAQHSGLPDALDFQDLAREKATRRPGPQQVDTPVDASREAARCLRCDQVCSICVTVCPNRANIAVRRQDSWPLSYPVQRAVRRGEAVAVETLGSVPVAQRVQVVNVADFCNECGNCAVFCPTSGAPYRHKPRLHLSRESFEAAGEGAWFREPWSMEAVIQGSAMSVTSTFFGGRAVLKVKTPVFTALLDAKTLEAASVALATGVAQAELALAAQAAMLYALALTIHPILSEPSC
ncbi:hypothetical protein [Fundidesulfovibrio putealis]|uniref:hypothetical protein n=1 Tax=Fundidesulfovibrio putealis TaxID=270496 RepID=UPI0004229F6B|nr:hypothetical protein [Fundidesulfovibrio putealis]